jgi:AraC family transcriptional activator of pobA
MDEMVNNLYYSDKSCSKNMAENSMASTQKLHGNADVPQFALYGESASAAGNELVHIELIETRSRLYDWEIANHTHSGLFQILFLLGGHVSARIDTEIWDCSGPSVITIHPSVVHGFHFSAEAYGYVLTVDQSILSHERIGSSVDIFSGLFLQPLALDLHAAPEAMKKIEALLQQMLLEFSEPLRDHTLMLDWLTRCVLLLLLRQHADRRQADLSGHADFELFSRLRASVEENYKAQWSVAQHAAALNVTESRLNRLCVKLTGKSAFDLLQQRLMLEARRRLTYVPASISSIAYELGFQDPAYFSRAFKRATGMTPKGFRERMRVDNGKTGNQLI